LKSLYYDARSEKHKKILNYLTLNMCRALCPSSGEQDRIKPRVVFACNTERKREV